MCGGASRVLIRDLHIPVDLINRLSNNGLGTAQAVLDEGRHSLLAIGCSSDDIDCLSEAIDRECDQKID